MDIVERISRILCRLDGDNNPDKIWAGKPVWHLWEDIARQLLDEFDIVPKPKGETE